MNTAYRSLRVIASSIAVSLFLAFTSVSFVPSAQAESMSPTSYASDSERREQMLLMIQQLLETIAQLQALLEVQQSASQSTTESAIGTYKGYLDGSLFITTKNISKNEALDNCKLNHSNNQTKNIRCTWSGREIFSFTPTDTESESEAELHAVGVYEAAGAQHSFCYSNTGDITVKVQKTSKPVILALSSYEPVNWNISLASDSELQKVIVGGYNVQTVTGISKSIPVESYTFYTKSDEQSAGPENGVFYDARYVDDGKYYHWASEPTMCPESAGVPVDERVALETNGAYYYGYDSGTSEYKKWISKLETITDLEVASSQGSYSGSSFTVPKE